MNIKVNNISLNYQKLGSGHPLILLHGNQEDSRIFDRLMAALSAQYTVYIIDSRGHGQSETPSTFSYQDMVEDVASFIRKLNLKQPYLFGFSDGGIIGLMLASQYPNILRKLVVAGANTDVSGLTRKERLKLKVENLVKPNPLVKLMLTQPPITDAQLRRITVPVIAMVGEKDVVTIEHTREFSSKIKNARLMVMPKQTHDSYIIHSLYLAPTLKNFYN
ncbi:alpha/beta hydrolase [Holzapfeliella sp. He02]|uniref:Alpha/beta hydrolase n=1 Tax=Holzapfeliella saturejae TaxID=3082953 RepID=A0ABU8SEW8_9LACO